MKSMMKRVAICSAVVALSVFLCMGEFVTKFNENWQDLQLNRNLQGLENFYYNVSSYGYYDYNSSYYYYSSSYYYAGSPDCNVSSENILILQQFYDATNGENWDYPYIDDAWDFSEQNPNPCDWHGISCDELVEESNSTECEWVITGLNLYEMNLQGAIPDIIGSLKYLRYVDLSSNYLTGSLPNSLGNLTSLFSLLLYGNEISGSIPQSIGSLSFLQYLHVDDNLLSAMIPGVIGDLSNLRDLYLDHNLLSGPIPENIGDLSNLRDLFINNNRLSGPIPDSIGDLSSLKNLNLDDNQLSGPIPDSIGDLSNLDYMYLNNNQLSGTIPDSIGDLSNLQDLFINSNKLSGTFPDSFMEFWSLESLYLEGNQLSGTVTDSIWSLPYLALSHNHFSGLLFISSDIVLLFASHNRFSSLYVDENTTVAHVDMSDNNVHGTLPAHLFSDSLQRFVATSNCFSGSIPMEICDAASLITLSLNGLGTANSCRKLLLPAINEVSSFSMKKSITGGIPECIFALPYLETLQLSGNNIKGTLSNDLVVSDSLEFISLSHNSLSGTIPKSLLTNELLGLDLGFNRFGGAVGSSVAFVNETRIVLEVNRLSGDIPRSWIDLEDINILTGNMFDCGVDGDGLPVNDKAYEIFQCGSQSFYQAGIFWIVAFGVVLLVVLLMNQFHYLEYAVRLWQLYYREFDDVEGNHSLHQFGQFLFMVLKIISYWTLFVVLILLPVYVALKHYYSTIQYQYAWTVSVVFLSGTTPAVVLVVFYALFMVVLFTVWTRVKLNEVNGSESSTADLVPKSSWLQLSALWLMVICNCVITTVVNGAYVVATFTCSAGVLFFIQIVMAVFKLVWNDVVIKEMVLWSRRLYQSSAAESIKGLQNAYSDSPSDLNIQHLLNEVYETQEMPFMTFVVLFNNIVAPCIATTAVDSNCFYHVFIPPDPVINGFETLSPLGTLVYVTRSYDPAFSYSYQCSSLMVTNYAVMYVLMYLLVGLVKPLLVILLAVLYKRIPKGTRIEWLIHKNAFNLLNPATEKQLHKEKALLRKDTFVLRYLGKISVFLTFGVVFPPLAIVLWITFVAETLVNTLLVGRFLTEIRDPILYCRFKQRLNRDFRGIADLLLTPLVRLLFPFVAIFYGFFVFDILGDEVGYSRAIWISVSLLCWTLLVWLCCSVYLFFNAKSRKWDAQFSEVQLVTDSIEYHF